jgi:hypothetical protein
MIRKIVFVLMAILTLLISCKSESPFNYSSYMNKTLYKSCLNIIEINPKYRFSDLTCTNGELKKINDTLYSILIDTSYQTKLIFKHKKSIQEINFRVKKMPKPELRFWSKDDIDLNNITLKQFRELRGIATILRDFSVDCIFETLSLTVIRIRNGEEQKIELTKPVNNSFDRIKFQAEKNDIYIFKDIKIEIQQTKRIINGQEITIFIK